MPLSNYLPSSRIIQPGVCTSSTRPASPYEGMVIYETDTNRTYVWNGSEWIMQISADAPPGLQLIKTQAIGSTPVPSVTVTGAFSSDYDNYRIVWSGTNCSVGDYGVVMKFGSAAAYYYGNMTYYKIGTGQGFLPINNGTGGFYCSIQGAYSDTGVVMDVFNPYNSVRTACTGAGFGWLSQFSFSGLLADAGSYNSFTFVLGTGTMTGGTIRVYGYRN